MTFDNWRTVAALFFCVGLGAGLVCTVFICQMFWKISAFYCTAKMAARVAEKSLQEAQIRVNERMLAEQRARLGQLFDAVAKSEQSQELERSASLRCARKAVTQ